MKTLVILATTGLVLSACQLVDFDTPKQKNNSSFTEVGAETIPFEDRKRRKWDNPLVVDLDRDGWSDIVTTDHGSSINIHWNDRGKFSQPQTILKRDTHGISAADYDLDGIMELVVVQGGGNGKKPKFPLVFKVKKDRTVKRTEPFKHFEFTRGRASKFVDVDNNGTLEFIQSGFPLKIQPKGANFLYQLDKNNIYQYQAHLPQAKWLGYKSTVADVNGDGDSDVLFYGGADMVMLHGSEGQSFVNVTDEALGQLAKIDNVSGVLPFDYDNDGDLDLLLTRSNHQFKHHNFYDAEHKRFAFFTFLKEAKYQDLIIEGDFKMTNLQQAHPHFSVYYGQDKSLLTFDVDLHGHKDFSLDPQEAKGWPDDVSENGIYIGYLGNQTWRLYVNNRSRTAGVVENVINQMPVEALEAMPTKLLENQNGQFVDVSLTMGLNIQEQTKSSVAADFNNDGWIDLFVVKYGSMATENEQMLFINQQGRGFELDMKANIISKEIGATGSGAAAFDYDHDGDMDLVYANERGLWHMFKNNLVSDINTNYLQLNVGYSPVNHGSYHGAKVVLEACGHNQIRYVSAGSSPFSQNSDQLLHFGLGQCQSAGQVSVNWSNGETQTIQFDQANQILMAGQY